MIKFIDNENFKNATITIQLESYVLKYNEHKPLSRSISGDETEDFISLMRLIEGMTRADHNIKITKESRNKLFELLENANWMRLPKEIEAYEEFIVHITGNE